MPETEEHWFLRTFKKKKEHVGTLESNKDAYKGYLIGYDARSKRFTIEKGGTRISSSEPTLESAKNTVDQLAD